MQNVEAAIDNIYETSYVNLDDADADDESVDSSSSGLMKILHVFIRNLLWHWLSGLRPRRSCALRTPAHLDGLSTENAKERRTVQKSTFPNKFSDVITFGTG